MAKQAEQTARGTPSAAVPDGAKMSRLFIIIHFSRMPRSNRRTARRKFKNGIMEMWTPTQIPASGHGWSEGTGLAPKDVECTSPGSGGGFGRRGSQ